MSGWLSPEKKAALVQAIIENKETKAKIAKRLGINRTTVVKTAKKLLSGEAPTVAPPKPEDPVERLRQEDEVSRLRREIKDLTARTLKAESLRSSVLGLSDTPPEPVYFGIPPAHPEPESETVVLLLSDFQWGEVIDLAAMDGVNSFNAEIARKRCKRAFTAAVELMTRHWKSAKPPARIILILGGDMISGEIHEELAKTNDAQSIPALKDCAAHLMGGIDLLLRELPCPIDIISIPGNHGRTTRKPESKGYAHHSYDTLVADLLEVHYQAIGEKRVSFFSPASGDARFNIYGWRLLATHGDRIGSRGGAGFVGPAATIARGFKKLVAEYAARGDNIDLVLIGHFHCALQLEEGFCNGSLAGPSEYSRDFRYRPKPAVQLFLTIHPKRFITQQRWLQVGDASEGLLYAAPDPTPAKPRYRVPAVVRAA